jgi:hypothetical protein
VISSSTDGAPAHQPRLSIIVIAFNDPALLGGCLDALALEARDDDVETLVVAKWPRARIRRGEVMPIAHRKVRWIEAAAEATVPQMRGTGIAVSHGEIVALIEDDCIVQRGWCAALLAAHRAPAAAIGGAVEPRPYRRALDWAVYFCDYGRFMPPIPAGPAVALAGNNMSYKRQALANLPAALRQEFQEVFVHRAWQQQGVPMLTDPAVVVRNVNSWTIAHVTAIPYHHARAFAARRVEGEPMWQRMTMSVLAVLLPVVKVLRVARETVSRRRHVGALIRALPMIGLLAISWSIGECVGYIWGPGESAGRWR